MVVIVEIPGLEMGLVSQSGVSQLSSLSDLNLVVLTDSDILRKYKRRDEKSETKNFKQRILNKES